LFNIHGQQKFSARKKFKRDNSLARHFDAAIFTTLEQLFKTEIHKLKIGVIPSLEKIWYILNQKIRYLNKLFALLSLLGRW